MNETLDQLDFFYAYDEGLINYLKRKGFKYITKAKHIRTENVFAIFIVTEQLNEHVKRWNKLHS